MKAPGAPFPNMAGGRGGKESRKAKYDMETFDEVLVGHSKGNSWIKAKKDGQSPFLFCTKRPDGMSLRTSLRSNQAMINSRGQLTGWQEAGMAQLDDRRRGNLPSIGRYRRGREPIVIFTQRTNGCEVFTGPDVRPLTPFKSTKATVFGKVASAAEDPLARTRLSPARENGIFSGLDWFPTLVAAAGDPDIANRLLKGCKIGDPRVQEPLGWLQPDGLSAGKGPSARMSFLLSVAPPSALFALMTSSISIIQQPFGWPGEKETETECPRV